MRSTAIGPTRPKFMDDASVVAIVEELKNGGKGPGTTIKFKMASKEDFQLVCNINWTAFCLGGSIGIKAHREGEPTNRAELIAIDINNIEKRKIRFSPFVDINNSRAAAAVKILQLECGEAAKTYIKDVWSGNSPAELEKVAKPNHLVITPSHSLVDVEGHVIKDIVVTTVEVVPEVAAKADTPKIEEVKGEDQMVMIEERRAARHGMKRKVVCDSLVDESVRLLKAAKVGDSIKVGSVGTTMVAAINYMAFTSGCDKGIAHRGKGRWLSNMRDVEAITPHNLMKGIIKFSPNDETNELRVRRAIEIINKEKGITTPVSEMPTKPVVEAVSQEPILRVPTHVTRTPTAREQQVRENTLADRVYRILTNEESGSLVDRIHCIEAAAKLLQRAGVLNPTVQGNLNEAILESLMESKDLISEILG